MSLLTNQTNINPSSTFFLESDGSSTVPVFPGGSSLSEISFTANQTTLITTIPIPDQYAVGDTILFQTGINMSGFSDASVGGIYEFSVAFSNEDDESSGNQNYLPLILSESLPAFKFSLQLTEVRRSSAINVAIRVRNTTDESIVVSSFQFLRPSFQFVCSNSI